MSHQFVLLRYRVPKSAKILFTWVLVWRLDGQRGRRTLCPRYYDRSLGGAKRRHTMTMYWAGVVLWVQDSHVQKYLAIRTQNIVRPKPHQPPLFHYRPQSLISIPRSPFREEMCRDVLKPPPSPRPLQSPCQVTVHPLYPGSRWHPPQKSDLPPLANTPSPPPITESLCCWTVPGNSRPRHSLLRFFLPSRDIRHFQGVCQRLRVSHLGGGEASSWTAATLKPAKWRKYKGLGFNFTMMTAIRTTGHTLGW